MIDSRIAEKPGRYLLHSLQRMQDCGQWPCYMPFVAVSRGTTQVTDAGGVLLGIVTPVIPRTGPCQAVVITGEIQPIMDAQLGPLVGLLHLQIKYLATLDPELFCP